jgi:hypothetical protein
MGRLAIFADPGVTLTWNPSSDPNAVGYKVYYGGASGVYTNTVEVGDTTNAVITGLVAGDTYYFSATTVDASGAESAFSNEASYVIPADETNAPSAASLPPTLDPIANLTIYQNAGSQTVDLTGIGSGSTNDNTVLVSAVSSDPTIISTPTVNYPNSGSTGTLTLTPVANALGTATVTVTVDNGDTSNNLVSETFTVTVATPPVANPIPTLDAITNLTIYENAGTQTVALAGIASGLTSGFQYITIWAYSSDSSILPDPTVNYTSPDDTGMLTFAPVTNALGTATVEVKVNNGAANFSQTFTVSVVSAPVAVQPPTLDAITNVTINENAGTQTVTLTGIGSGPANGSALSVTAVSSDTTIIGAPTVSYTSPNSTGTVTFAPVTNASGAVTITVTVSSGSGTESQTSQTFTVNVLPVVKLPPSTPVTNTVPTSAQIANVCLIQGTTPQTIPLTGFIPVSTAPSSPIRFIATSSNPRLLPEPLVRCSNPGTNMEVTLRLMPVDTGVATITVTAIYGGKSNNIVRQSFTVTVIPPAQPTLDPIANVTVADNAGAQTILLTGISSGSTNAGEALRVSAISSPRSFRSKIQYASPATTALLTFTPPAHFIGSATVTVTVNNGDRFNGLVRRQFAITVTPATTNGVVAHDVGFRAHTVVEPNVAATLTPLASAVGGFSFQVTGVVGGTYVVQATSDLVNWTAIQTNTAPFTCQDSTAGVPQRFYRAYCRP